MVSRRRFNTTLAGAAGWAAAGPLGTAGAGRLGTGAAGPLGTGAAGPLGTAAAQSQPRGAVYASLGARLYRIRRDGDSLVRAARPVILPAQVQEGWQHPSGRYFYIASSDQRTSTARVRHHYLNAFRVDSSGDLEPHGGAVELPHRPIFITVDQRGEYLLSAYSFPSS
ncbi:MAG: hypothetical protein OXG35_23000, partial [Acidobacteria bacterium]|nr:hypothetical protein [Acidobacteriota bacterium]